MSNASEPTNIARARLATLPRRTGLVITGGKRPLNIYIREGNQTIQPQIALWLDAESGFVFGTRIISPSESADNGVREAVDALVETMIAPIAPSRSDELTLLEEGGKRRKRREAPLLPHLGLPDRITVNDADVAEAALALFAPLGIPVEYDAYSPAFEEAYTALAKYMGARPDGAPPEPFAWEIAPALLPPLYKAANGYARRAPWRYMPDHPAIALTLGEHGPEPGVETLYACILGGAGMVIGVAFYYSLDDVRAAMETGAQVGVEDAEVDEAIAQLRQSGAPVDDMPTDMLREMVRISLAEDASADETEDEDEEDGPLAVGESMVVFFDPAVECDPTYLDWLRERGIAYAGRRLAPSFFRVMAGGETRDLTDQEAAALASALGALNQFLTHYEPILTGPFLPDDPLIHRAHVGTGRDKWTVEVRFPPPGEGWGENEEMDEPLAPASPTGPTTLYRFQVKLAWKKSVWRRIELRGDQTLHDLHRMMQFAFDLGDDHLYAFYLSGKAWDSLTEYGSPLSDSRNAARYRLEHLPLAMGQRFLYIFDFGDDIRFQITLEAIIPSGVVSAERYPQITAERGTFSPQY
ncbi:MAG: plasmid pRiA4b ORF-3 family protein [Chloroflexota bacterium]|nr:plasmid pRiA4b ORF-3 family protein [Chloroflexota bacterium]